ncbi:TrkA family potassium uptake protein [Geomicrobium sp. JSM 1781026]|uniref:potassium channel family protein n=1 Tax=Geomicrobium sp. JSM 1781026 TaxID=3344580 RepID=UPI0035BFA1DF
MKRKQFVVIGLGRFGVSVTKTLIGNGHEVLAIDIDEHKVQEISTDASYAVQIDATDEVALEQLGIHKYSHAIVGIGEDLQASILITLLLKEMEVEKITAKAKDEHHGKVLTKIGADQVIFPERDMGRRLGNLIGSNHLVDYLELSDDYHVEEILVQKGMSHWKLEDLDVNRKYGCTIVAIKDRKQNIDISPKQDRVLREGDILILIGKPKSIQKMQKDYDKTVK